MGGGGSIANMLATMRNNALRKKESLFDREVDTDTGPALDIKKTPLTMAEREAIRRKLKKENRQDLLKKTLGVFLIFVLLSGLIYLVINYFPRTLLT